MSLDARCDGRRSGPSGWVTWGVFDDVAGAEESRWLDRLRCDSFRFLVGMATAALVLLAVRYRWMMGVWHANYLANACFFLSLFCLVSWRRDWHRSLSWLGMASFLVSALIALGPYSGRAIVPTHMILPLVVLYAALLGDLWMGGFATLGVLALYLHAGIEHWPLGRHDLLILMNLCGVTVMAGLGTFGVWLQHRRFAESHRMQAASLRRELDARLRMNAILFHDIRNPLAALMGAAEMVKANPGGDPAGVGMIEQMADRIWDVIDSAREIGSDFEVELSAVPVERLWAEQEDVFASRLEAKGQKLARAGGDGLMVWTHRDIVCNSVLSNIVSNAIKFSPRGSTIELGASEEGEHVRLEVRDRGAGFSADVLAEGSRGGRYDSHAGTEGETGHAYGLRIAALCLSRLGGRLEVRNQPGGGASVGVLLPRDGKPASR